MRVMVRPAVPAVISIRRWRWPDAMKEKIRQTEILFVGARRTDGSTENSQGRLCVLKRLKAKRFEWFSLAKV